MPSTQSLSHPFQAPPLTLLAMEPLRAAFDFCAAAFGAAAVSIGDGHPVIVFPGLGAAPFTTSHLRRFLTDSGFGAQCWGRGVNTGPEGDFDRWLDGLEQDVRDLHARSGHKVSLVGWSLGGVYAREIAKRCPECVRQVITLGTPFASLRSAMQAGSIYPMLGAAPIQLTPSVERRLRTCPPVPTTSIYSKSDGVVCWQGCIEKNSALSESVEVSASHLGMATHPDVLRILAERLAQPEGQWQPLHRSVPRTRTRRLPAAAGVA